MIRLLEKNKHALSLSVIHGFMAGDSPDIGAKIITITDSNKNKGDKLSSQLGLELCMG